MAKIEMTGIEMELRDAIYQEESHWVNSMGEKAVMSNVNEIVLKIRKLVGEVETFENVGCSKWRINGKKISAGITYRNDTGRFYNSVKALKN